MKKFIYFTLVFMLLMLTGCTKTISYTFSVETGDNIQVSLETTEDYSLSQSNGQFSVNKDSSNILTGVFISEDNFYEYLEAVLSSDNVDVIKQTEDSVWYTYYDESHTENNFIQLIPNSSTGILVASLQERSEAEKVFNMLTFTKK